MEIVEVGECTEIGEEPEEVYTHIVAPSTTGVYVCVFVYVCECVGRRMRDVVILRAPQGLKHPLTLSMCLYTLFASRQNFFPR